MRRDLGDFQTPPELVAAVLETLGPIGAHWPRVLEPTCGRGSFIAGLLAHRSPPREIRGFEIQPAHCRAAEGVVADGIEHRTHVTITCADLFQVDLGGGLKWREDGPLLVVGNPPWVTSAELGSLAGAHQPPRSNVNGLAGLDAVTGLSNFDVAEAVWIKLARELAAERPTIAILCKTSAARRILRFVHRAGWPFRDASIRRIDAPRWFGAAVDACLFRITLGAEMGATSPSGGIPLFRSLGASEPDAVIGLARGGLVADVDAYHRVAFVDGTSPATWRQGLKHDAAAVMELTVDPDSGRLRNLLGEEPELEPAFVYPLVKGADLRVRPGARPGRAVIVTQGWTGDDTKRLVAAAPRLWTYLKAHTDQFERRRSSIYRGRPPFAIFGIGPYSFAPFKVAVSGLGKSPAFRALGPRDGRPVMLDDTCYFLACSSPAEAAAVAALCNDALALSFLASTSFPDAKRPITKALLQRLDLRVILARGDRGRLGDRAATVLADELAVDPDQRVLGDVDEAWSMLENRWATGRHPE